MSSLVPSLILAITSPVLGSIVSNVLPVFSNFHQQTKAHKLEFFYFSFNPPISIKKRDSINLKFG